MASSRIAGANFPKRGFYLVLTLTFTSAVVWSRGARADAVEELIGGDGARSGESSDPGDPKAPKGEGSKEKPAAPESLDLTIYGDETKVGGSAHRLKPKDLARFRYDDPQQTLMAVPGITARGEDGFGLRPNIGMRGVTSDRSKKLTLMEDDVLFGPAPYSAPAAYYFPLMARMRGVSILKGPAGIVAGPNTVAGAINFTTLDIPATPTGFADLTFGQYWHRKAHVGFGMSNESSGFVLEGVHLANNGFKILDGGGDTGFYRNEWMLKGSHAFAVTERLRHELLLKLGFSNESSNETYLGLTDADFRASPNRRYLASQLDVMNWTRTSFALSHAAKASDLEIVTTVYRNDLHRVWNRFKGLRSLNISDVLLAPNAAVNTRAYGVITGTIESKDPRDAFLIGPNDRTFVSQGYQTVVRTTFATGEAVHRVEYGVRAHYDSIQRLHTADGYLIANGKLVRDGLGTALEAQNKGSAYALASHVLDSVTFKKLTVTFGGRFELMRLGLVDDVTKTTSNATVSVFIPGASAVFSFTEAFSALAGVHRGFSPPAPGPGPLCPKTA